MPPTDFILKLSFQHVAIVDNILELVKKPLVNTRHLVQLVDSVLLRLERRCQHKDPLVGWIPKLLLVVLAVDELTVRIKTQDAVVDHAQRLLVSSKPRPIAITSLTLFIEEPILLETRPMNLFRSQRGTFTTQ